MSALLQELLHFTNVFQNVLTFKDYLDSVFQNAYGHLETIFNGEETETTFTE